MDPETIYNQVHNRYSASALTSTSGNRANVTAQAFGYSAEEISQVPYIPTSSNLGLSCGNPLAIASLQEGETVIDLGCGAGFDVFLAAKKVEKHGKVIGIDMKAVKIPHPLGPRQLSPRHNTYLQCQSKQEIQDMLSKARHNAATSNTPNVTFLQSRITSINLPDAYADLIISNCVINLVPHDEKHRVFAEMHRLLKPGGRVAVSDILTWAPLPEDLQKNVALYVSCVAGASTKAEYERWLGEAGFEDVLVVHSGGDLNVYTQHGGGLGSAKEGVCGDAGDVTLDGPACCSSTSDDGGVAQDMCRYLRDVDLNSLAGSFKIFAVKK